MDYSKFPQLESLSVDWYTKFPSLVENKELKELHIWKFKPKDMSFLSLSLPDCIENIEIVQSNIRDFEGLNLPNLKKIEAHYCNKLVSLQGVENATTTLKCLIVDYCKHLIDYDMLPTCIHLEKIILGNCGDMPNLNWLTKLKNVKHFSFWGTKILDGDISPCFGIKYVGFKDSKYYNHKLKEFNNMNYLKLD